MQFPYDQACFQACLSTEVQVDCEVWPAMHAQTDNRLSSGRHKGPSEQEGVACGASSAEVVHTADSMTSLKIYLGSANKLCQGSHQ